MEQEELFEYFEAYLAKSLSAEDRLKFETRLKEETEFAEEFDLHRQLQEEYGESGISEFRTIIREEAAAKPVAKVRSLNTTRIASIAATVALLIAAGVFYFNNQSVAPGELYAQYIDQPNLSFDAGIRRGEETQSLDSLSEIIARVDSEFQNQQYSLAIGIINGLDPALYAGLEDQINFRLGLLHLFNDDASTALESFEKVENMSESTRWYKSMTLLKLDRTDGINELLSPLTTFDNPKREAAEFILKKMR